MLSSCSCSLRSCSPPVVPDDFPMSGICFEGCCCGRSCRGYLGSCEGLALLCLGDPRGCRGVASLSFLMGSANCCGYRPNSKMWKASGSLPAVKGVEISRTLECGK